MHPAEPVLWRASSLAALTGPAAALSAAPIPLARSEAEKEAMPSAQFGEQRLAGAAGPQASRQGADYPRPPCFPLGSKWEGSVVAKVTEKTHTGYLGRQGKRLVVEDVFGGPGSDREHAPRHLDGDTPGGGAGFRTGALALRMVNQGKERDRMG